MAIADTRIIRAPGNVLTEHGPKVLPITIVCKQPGGSGFFDREVYRAEIGFAYSGSTLSALAAHALSSTLLSKLVGAPDAPPPALDEIATFIAGTCAEYMCEVCQLAGQDGMFSSIVFGCCAKTGVLRAFQLSPTIEHGPPLRVVIQEHALNPIRIGGTSSESVIVIGSSPALLIAAIDHQLADAKTRGEIHEIVAFDAPKRALRTLIRDGSDARVGGSIQQAWATAAGFEIMSNMEAGNFGAGRNWGSFILGFDTDNIQAVGNYKVASVGR